MSTGYCVLWEFHVPAERRAEFERRYGPDGDWATLFRRGNGFRGLELLRDREDPGRYLTLDRWVSADACREFHERNAGQCAALDRECAQLTAREARLGEFESAR